MSKTVVVLVAMHSYRNVPVRLIHPVLKNIPGIEPYVIFLKHCDTNLFSPPTAREERLFVDLITRLHPKLVGLSVLTPYVPMARKLNALVRKHTSALVVWGGVHPTIFPEDCTTDADIVCQGEGEGAMSDLAIRLRDGKPFQDIENLWLKDQNNHVIQNPMRPLLQDLDAMPFMASGDESFHFIESNKVTNHDPVLSEETLWIQSSRGCPYTCSFCVEAVLHKTYRGLGRLVRIRSVDNLLEEIKANLNMPRRKIKDVQFIDEIFGVKEDWCSEFEEKYKKEIGLPFEMQANPDGVKYGALAKLVSAGLAQIGFGIQTGSDYMRNQLFNRPGKNTGILKLSKELEKYKIRVKYDFIINNPYDTEQTLEDGIEVFLQLPKPLYFNLFSLQYFPKYPFTDMALKDGHIQAKDADTETLLERTTKNWAYIPRFFPYTRKQILQNVMWLVIRNFTKDEIVKTSVFGKSFKSKVGLNYLNLKAIILGRIYAPGGLVWRSRAFDYFINGIKYLFRGDVKALNLKIRKVVLSELGNAKRLRDRQRFSLIGGRKW